MFDIGHLQALRLQMSHVKRHVSNVKRTCQMTH
jgi:hypothetical protein